MSDYPAISADSHLNEPHELYQRLPEKYRARAPHIVKNDEGKRFIVMEGQPPMPIEAPNPLNEDDMLRYWREEGDDDVGRVYFRGAGIDVDSRLRDQEADGICAEIIYPHGVFTTFSSPDPDFQMAMARILNDYYHAIFAEYRDRLVVSAVLPMMDLGAAIAEAERVAKLGFRSLSIPIGMSGQPYNLPRFEKFWSAIEEMGLVLGLHTFTSSEGNTHSNLEFFDGNDAAPIEPGPGDDLTDIVLDLMGAAKPLCQLVASGVLQRHPALKFVLVECGIGWLAFVLQTLDQMQQKRHMWVQPRLELRASEYFRRQGALTFTDDAVGVRNRDLTGVECLMWGNDYPHDEGTFPHSQEAIERTFVGVSEADRYQMLVGNAARFYDLPVPEPHVEPV